MNSPVLKRDGKIAKSNYEYYPRHVSLSVWSRETTRLPLDGFS